MSIPGTASAAGTNTGRTLHLAATRGIRCRFGEAENVGRKLWYAINCDFYGMRVPQLMSQPPHVKSLDGDAVPLETGHNIIAVGISLSGLGVFKHPERTDLVSRLRFTSARTAAGIAHVCSAGLVSETRDVFDLVVNGPMRSVVRMRTMNWDSGRGRYASEQRFAAYSSRNHATCSVRFTTLSPVDPCTVVACGIRRRLRTVRSVRCATVLCASCSTQGSTTTSRRGRCPTSCASVLRAQRASVSTDAGWRRVPRVPLRGGTERCPMCRAKARPQETIADQPTMMPCP